MSERRKPYPFDQLEPKWQQLWDERRAFRSSNPGDADFDATKPKYYVLDMFPYPSGSGLHVGHPEGYTATDIMARYKRMRGYNVLHPMGWDAFGLPAEQYAIRTGQHPAITTAQNVAKFKTQLKRIGFSYDWEREISTTDPRYYRWTQWIFLQIYHSWFNPETQRAEPIATYRGADPDAVRLAYVAEVPVNWCPELGTVLANEEVIDGKSEVGGFPVVRRPMRQWMLRITAYAQRLIDELDGLDWPEGIKLLQRNWIGQSVGAVIDFDVAQVCNLQDAAESELKTRATISVFTTRPDTLYGATYMVLAPEHPLVDELATEENRSAIAEYRQQISSKSDLERTDLAKEKTGVCTGAFAINPASGERIPIWIADYVLMGYGTGAIMAVPAHDERDLEFARKFELPIRVVVTEKPTETGFSTPSFKHGVKNPGSVRRGFLDPQEEIEVHRNFLPHWQQPGALYFLTWRLADSLPPAVLDELREERTRWLAAHSQPWSDDVEAEYHLRFTQYTDELLDRGSGGCVLARADAGAIVADALRFFDGKRYALEAYCIMPNHVHVLVRLHDGEKLPDLLQSWKRHTAREINRLLQREGPLWQEDYFDRLVRSEEHFAALKRYIAANPVKANLSGVPVWIRDDAEAATEAGFSTPPSKDGVKNPASVSAPPAAFTGEGWTINSPVIDSLTTAEAKQKIIAWLEENGSGRRDVSYKLRDWLFSRQRYWGEPFPIIWRGGKHESIPESELPLEPPPLDDFKPTGTGEPPLARAQEWIRYSETATRETNTMPQWAGSCWYYLRFCDPHNNTRFVDEEAERYWMGGQQSTVLTRSAWTEQLRQLYDIATTTSDNRKRFITFGVVQAEEAESIRHATGINALGFRRYIDVFAIRHVHRRHGPKAKRPPGEVAVEFDDLVHLVDIVRSPDVVRSGGVSELGLPTIRYEKQIGDAVCYVEEVLLGRGLLAAKTMFKKAATASRAPRGLAHTSETLRRTDEIVAVLPFRGKKPQPGGVDLYVGGTEHAVLHLLYARFWQKVLFDLGHLSKAEPFQRLVNQGMILGEDGRKMSKRWGNVIDPLDVIADYGADAFRCYEMFMGPLEQMKPWSMNGVEGSARFLARVWRLVMEENQAGEWVLSGAVTAVEPQKAEQKVLHATIKKVTADIETLSFNTAIAQMMVLTNTLTNAPVKSASAIRTLLVLLNPIAPHLTSELWEVLQRKFGGTGDITEQPWPQHEEQWLIEDEGEIVIQVNGRVRGKMTVALAATEAELEAAALADPKVQELIAGKTVRKVVVVPKKLVNVVAN
ncbi:hypothetical protein BH20VER1_BH20VER1_08750 [soil metagenome]